MAPGSPREAEVLFEYWIMIMYLVCKSRNNIS